MALVTFWLLVGTCFYLAAGAQTGNNMPVAPTPLGQMPADLKSLGQMPPMSFSSMPGGPQMPPMKFAMPGGVQMPSGAPPMPLASLPGISKPIAPLPGVSKIVDPSIPVRVAPQPVPISQSSIKAEVDRQQLELINMPPNFSQKYLDFDPCLSSPCMFGRICQSMPDVAAGFICLNEIDANKDVSDARVIYRNMELLAKDALLLNVETITNHGVPPFAVGPDSTGVNQGQHVLLTLKGKKKTKLTCEQNPCQLNEQCVPKPNSVEGFTCVKERISVVEEENSKIIAKLLDDNTFITEASKRCESSEAGQRLEIAHVPTHFISCLDATDFTIQSCPHGLVFNKYQDRCDIDQEPVSTGCASSPCQFGAQCHDLAHLDYTCECPKGFSGKNCEIAPDVCATAPCGHADGNVCHVLPAETTGLRYYCTCSKGRTFGLSCEESQVEKNPCDLDTTELNTVFSTRLGPSVFGICDEDRQLNLRVCDKQMQAMGKCKWLTRLGLQRDRRAVYGNAWIRKGY